MCVKRLTIFYSWQSYIGGHANCSYIRDKIQAAYEEIGVEYELLEDSRGESGSPDIPNAILTKISKSDIFICDVTPVTVLELDNGHKRAIPNPNVMFELGFAVRCLGWERIVCICNLEYGSVEYLPFDIASRRIIKYRKKKDARNSEESLCLTLAIKSIIENYEQTISKGNEFDYKKHDIDVFHKLMSFTTERDFINGLTDFRSSGRFFKWYERCWDHYQYFQDYPENKFISPCLNDGFAKLVDSLDKLKSLTRRICVGYNLHYWKFEEPNIDYTPEQIKELLMTQEYRKRDIPYPNNQYKDAVMKYDEAVDNDIRDIQNVANDVITSYTEFRVAVKQELAI